MWVLCSSETLLLGRQFASRAALARITHLLTAPKQHKKWTCTHTEGFCWHGCLSQELHPDQKRAWRSAPLWEEETWRRGVTHPNSESKAERWAELEQSTFLPHFSAWLQTDSIATELCIPMYNYLLISWLAYYAKKVSRNVEQRHFSSSCLSDQRNDRSYNLLGASTFSTLRRLAEVEVCVISQLHLVLRRKRKRANHASLILKPGTLMAVAVAASRVMCWAYGWSCTKPWRCWEKPTLPHTILWYLTAGEDYDKECQPERKPNTGPLEPR